MKPNGKAPPTAPRIMSPAARTAALDDVDAALRRLDGRLGTASQDRTEAAAYRAAHGLADAPLSEDERAAWAKLVGAEPRTRRLN